MDIKKPLGGSRPGAGRKSKADEEKVNAVFLSALKKLYDTDCPDEAKLKFITEKLLKSQRGELFVAEHMFGKAPQIVEQTNTNIDGALTDEEIERIKSNLLRAY